MPAEQRGVLLVNMGGPSGLSEVEPYLRAIFNDPAILPVPNALRPFIASRIAARRRDKVAERYRLAGGSSPLYHWTPILRELVQTEFDQAGIAASVAYAFRYSAPTIEEQMSRLAQSGVTGISLLPLFPHFTEAMTGSVITEARRVSRKLNIQLGVINDWGRERAVIDLWAGYLQQALDRAGDHARVLFVAHGIPRRNVERGEDYPRRVMESAEALGSTLHSTSWSLAFQSRLGPVKWTEPYLENELERICRSSNPLVIMPLSFVSECLETIYDLDIVATRLANDAGVSRVIRVSAFNDDSRFAEILASLAIPMYHAVHV
jgi:ferrochelatase